MQSKTKWLVGGVLALGILGVVAVSGANTSAPSSQSAAVVNSQQQQVSQSAPVSAQQPTQPQAPLSNNDYYTNSSGNTVHSPAYSETDAIPAGATAQCRDGTYSFSQHRSGTCSYHGGVAQWLH